LVPFGEQIPYEDSISWPSFIVPEDKKTFEIPGREYTVFKLGEIGFGAVICWEVVFPDLFREFVKRGANFMVNLTNEGWFGDSAAPYQMAAINAFRAVENRVPVARAANTGISCFIDQFGRITGRVSNNGKDTFVEGYLTQPIRASDEKTFYTRYGDVFVWICLLISMGFLLLAFLFKKRSFQN
jgi:apolipoprotein N-acyltransferase